MGEVIGLIDPAELVGRHEIAERAGVAVKTVDTWRQRYRDTFPEPLLELSGSPVWRWSDVAEWVHNTPREVGRPRSSPPPYRAIADIPPRLRRAIRTDPPDEGASHEETHTA